MEGFQVVNSWFNGKYYAKATIINGRPVENTSSDVTVQSTQNVMIDSSIVGDGNALGELPSFTQKPRKAQK